MEGEEARNKFKERAVPAISKKCGNPCDGEANRRRKDSSGHLGRVAL